MGGDPTKGAEAALESRTDIEDVLHDSDFIILTAGIGGGTGSGAAPVIARVAKDLGAFTIGVVTKPFTFEGVKRRLVAEEAIKRLREHLDALIVIPSDHLLAIVGKDITLKDAFEQADRLLCQAIQGICRLIDDPDMRTLLRDSRPALIMAIGYGRGEEGAAQAARAAISSAVLEGSIESAKGVLFYIASAGDTLTLFDVNQAADIITNAVDKFEANIMFGTVTEPGMDRYIKITLIVADFPNPRSSTDRASTEGFEPTSILGKPNELYNEYLTFSNRSSINNLLKERIIENLPPALFTEEGTALYPLSSAASIVGLSRKRVFELVKQGKIFGVKPATDWFVSLDDLRQYIEDPARKPGRPRKVNTPI